MVKKNRKGFVVVLLIIVGIIFLLKNMPPSESQGYMKVYDNEGNVILTEQLYQQQSIQQAVYKGAESFELRSNTKIPAFASYVEFGFNIKNTGDTPLLIDVSDAIMEGDTNVFIDVPVHTHVLIEGSSSFDHEIPVGSSALHKVMVDVSSMESLKDHKLTFNIQAQEGPSVPVSFTFRKESFVNVATIDDFDVVWSGSYYHSILTSTTPIGPSNILTYSSIYPSLSFVQKGLNIGNQGITGDDRLCLVAKASSLNFGSVNIELGGTSVVDQYEKEAIFTPSSFGSTSWILLKSPKFKDMGNQGPGVLDLNNIVRGRIILYGPNKVLFSFDKLFVCREEVFEQVISNFDDNWLSGYDISTSYHADQGVTGTGSTDFYKSHLYLSSVRNFFDIGNKGISEEDHICVIAKTNTMDFNSIMITLGSSDRWEEYEKGVIFTPSDFVALNQWVHLKSPKFKDMPNRGAGVLDLDNIVRARMVFDASTKPNSLWSFDQISICSD